MHYPVDTPQRLRAVLKALRQSRRLTQLQVGELLGVNQKRIARIEAAPELTSFDQISRLVAALGGRLVIDSVEAIEGDEGAARALSAQRRPREGETW